MADALYQLTGSAGTDLPYQGVTFLTIPGIYPHFDQFMVFQCKFKFVGHPITVTRIADDDERLEIMGQFAKMAFLRFCQGHCSGSVG